MFAFIGIGALCSALALSAIRLAYGAAYQYAVVPIRSRYDD